MKHASTVALERLDDLLGQLRRLRPLKERKPGIFYVGSKAFLHFHEDPSGLFADLRGPADWDRFSVNTTAERERLFDTVRRAVA